VTPASSAAPWLRVDKQGGLTPATFQISVSPQGLPPGEYATSLNVVSLDASNSSRSIAIVLRVSLPVLVTNAASLVPGPVAPGSLAIIEGLDSVTARTARIGAFEVPLLERRGARIPFVVPVQLPPGEHMLVLSNGTVETRAPVTVAPLAPGFFSAAQTGAGAALAETVLMVDGVESASPAFACNESGSECQPRPIVIGDTPPLLRLAATGVRGASDPSVLGVKIADEPVEILSLQPASDTRPGIDLITLRLPASLAGRREVAVVLAAGEAVSNKVLIRIQ